MCREFLAWLLVFSVNSCWATFATAGIDYPSIWQCDSARFNWYCDTEADSPQNIVQSKTPEDMALERVEIWQKELKAKRALSILEPTPEHVRAYIEAQEQLTQTAALYSDVWRRVVWQNPELNYELKRPANNAAAASYADERRAAEMRTLADINKEWGLFFFFRSDCPHCHRLAPTLKFLSETYGISVLPVSIDGGALPEYPQPQRDNGLVEKLGIRQVPMLVLGNVKDRRLLPLGSGVISAQDVIERIYILTHTQPGELY